MLRLPISATKLSCRRTRLLRQRHRQHRFALFADLGALRDKTQAVEVEIGAGSHRDQRLVLQPVPGGIRLGAGHGQRARRFQHGARILENILDRRADCIGIDQHHLVHILLAQAEGFLADVLHRRAVGEQPDLFQAHALAGWPAIASWRRRRRLRRR
jgi:hypothetical protein